MQKNNALFLLVGVVIGIIIGSVSTLALKKERYQYFTPSIGGTLGGRMDTSTGETWFLISAEGKPAQWVKMGDQK